MKQIILFACIVFATSCNSNDTKKGPAATETKTADTTVVAAKIDYPYTVDPMPNWQTGDPQNALNALKALKAYESGNMEEAAGYFGDSIHFYADKYEENLSNDGLKTMFLKDKNDGNSIKVKMNDWESVRSGDGKEEWVSMWYKQISTDKAGKVDSAEVMDDLKFKNGKIIVLDEKSRHYPVPKKK